MFIAVFTWGETLETSKMSWSRLAKLVKWRLQLEDGFEMCRVYTKSGQCIKAFTNF